jgi:two-component system nitrogen regulation response regulator GlnG
MMKRQPRVVIAEDDDALRAALAKVVSRLPIHVDEAESGGVLAQLLTDDEPIDLLITDVRLPWASGFQIAVSARNAGLRMPIIVVTALADSELGSKVEHLGSAVLLRKPFRVEELLSLVQDRLFPHSEAA